jgi:hypothetical protein
LRGKLFAGRAQVLAESLGSLPPDASHAARSPDAVALDKASQHPHAVVCGEAVHLSLGCYFGFVDFCHHCTPHIAVKWLTTIRTRKPVATGRLAFTCRAAVSALALWVSVIDQSRSVLSRNLVCAFRHPSVTKTKHMLTHLFFRGSAYWASLNTDTISYLLGYATIK